MKIKLNKAEITTAHILAAEQVLADNGIEADETSTVLQAIGYALLDTELYPEENDRDEKPWDYGKHFD